MILFLSILRIILMLHILFLTIVFRFVFESCGVYIVSCMMLFQVFSKQNFVKNFPYFFRSYWSFS